MTDEEKEKVTLYSLWSRQNEMTEKVSRIYDSLVGNPLNTGLIERIEVNEQKCQDCQGSLRKRLSKLELAFVGFSGILSGLGILSFTNLI